MLRILWQWKCSAVKTNKKDKWQRQQLIFAKKAEWIADLRWDPGQEHRQNRPNGRMVLKYFSVWVCTLQRSCIYQIFKLFFLNLWMDRTILRLTFHLTKLIITEIMRERERESESDSKAWQGPWARLEPRMSLIYSNMRFDQISKFIRGRRAHEQTV